MPNVRASLADGYSECGDTKTCTSFKKTLNYCSLIAVGSMLPTIRNKNILRTFEADFKIIKNIQLQPPN